MSSNPLLTTPAFDTNNAQQNYTDGRATTPSQSASSYAYPRSNASSSTNSKGYLAVGGHTRKPSIKDKIGDLINGQTEDDLPMYKDKPKFALRGRRGLISALFPRGRRKRWGILGVVLLFLVWWTGLFSSSSSTGEVGGKEEMTWWQWFMREEVDWNARRNEVRRVFAVSWDDYARHAWGMDEYSPVSQKGRMIVKGKGGQPGTAGVGWIIVDALDTAMMMNLTMRVAQARQWIATSLDFSQVDGPISTFEATIRILGGLLGAHYLSTEFPHLAAQRDDDPGMRGEDLYIEKAVELADRLLGAFDTPSGIPLASINLNTSLGIASREFTGASSIAEATTLQLELKYLSKITGEPLYWEKAEQIMKVVDGPRREGGLLPIFIDPFTGEFRGQNIRLGSRGDSYYEYLIKQYLQTGSRESVYSEMWEEALDGIKKYLISFSTYTNFTVLGERLDGLEGTLSGKMDHLVCFMPGTIALGVTGGQTVEEAKARMGSSWGSKQEADLLLAEELMKTCYGMYAVTPTGLAPEIAYMVLDDPPQVWCTPEQDPTWTQPTSNITFENQDELPFKDTPDQKSWHHDFNIHINDVHNLQRPETVESLFYLYRITRNEKYRHWAWKMFKSFTEHGKVTDAAGHVTGYTTLDSVMYNPRTQPQHAKSITGLNNKMVGNRPVSDTYRDHMEGFWLSETLKYFYLLFSDDGPYDPLNHPNRIPDAWFDLSNVVINTEAHFFPRFDIEGSKVWKTGWKRQERVKGLFEEALAREKDDERTKREVADGGERVWKFGDP